jgi:hypothetical protein
VCKRRSVCGYTGSVIRARAWHRQRSRRSFDDRPTPSIQLICASEQRSGCHHVRLGWHCRENEPQEQLTAIAIQQSLTQGGIVGARPGHSGCIRNNGRLHGRNFNAESMVCPLQSVFWSKFGPHGLTRHTREKHLSLLEFPTHGGGHWCIHQRLGFRESANRRSEIAGLSRRDF